jgi:dipeptidyl aminopeptidase/acylaminoacyl peptidase
MTRLILLLLCAALCPCAAAATTPTLEQSLSMRSVGSPTISPDGLWVAYTVSSTNWDDNSFDTEIWLHSTERSESLRLTGGKKSSYGPVWSPDSKWLAFVSDRDGKPQLYVISPRGGEALLVPTEEMSIRSAVWAPDGKSLVVISPGPETDAEKDRKKKYGEFNIEGEFEKHNHLWRLELPPDLTTLKSKLKPTALTNGKDFNIEQAAWSPDSQWIAFTAGSKPDLHNSHTVDLYTLRLQDRGIRKLVSSYGPESNPKWSPDSRHIAFETANGQQYFYYLNSRIAIIPVEGGPPRMIAADIDEDPSLIAWTSAGLYVRAQQKTGAGLFRVDASSGRFTALNSPSSSSSDFIPLGVSVNRDGTRAALTGALPNDFVELYVSGLSSFSPKKVTSMADQYKEFGLSTREVIQWKSNDGATIEGVLIKPAGYDPQRKYPLLVVIHGGPTGVDMPLRGPDRYYPIEAFAAKGALILRPNYRGSAGYGEKFRSLNVRNLGVGDAWDVISGVDYLVEKGMVDRDRAGAMGWSQGGYISAFLATSSDRFRAISVGAGISNWMTYYVNTDIHPFTRQYLQATPWDDPEIYRKTSPMSYINSAKTPTLIQHGDNDRRVPPPNAFELYKGLQDRGVPSRLVIYKGFGHGINKPKEHLHLMQQNYDWFSKYIWNEEEK